jgi:hypothetical protein
VLLCCRITVNRPHGPAAVQATWLSEETSTVVPNAPDREIVRASTRVWSEVAGGDCQTTSPLRRRDWHRGPHRPRVCRIRGVRLRVFGLANSRRCCHLLVDAGGKSLAEVVEGRAGDLAVGDIKSAEFRPHAARTLCR